jgi:hypothetical protein
MLAGSDQSPARILDHGGDLPLLVTTRGCHAAIWYSLRELRWPGVSLNRCELAEGTVRPGCVGVAQALGQHPAQVVLIDDQQPVEELRAQGADDPSQMGAALLR